MAAKKVEESRLYSTVKGYYPKYYSAEDVAVFVKAGKLTEDEYKKITGVSYEG